MKDLYILYTKHMSNMQNVKNKKNKMYILTKTFDYVRFEDFTAVTMKNGVFWDATPCGYCKNRRFGGT
jgi:hypothetical protein